jgi:hypothetical protein
MEADCAADECIFAEDKLVCSVLFKYQWKSLRTLSLTIRPRACKRVHCAPQQLQYSVSVWPLALDGVSPTFGGLICLR